MVFLASEGGARPKLVREGGGVVVGLTRWDEVTRLMRVSGL